MSHDAHAPTREEVLAGIDRPSLPVLKTISLVLAIIGLLVFVVGLFLQPDRAWQALLVSWLYFRRLVAPAYVRRGATITTPAGRGRSFDSSRGYVAFLRSRSCPLIMSCGKITAMVDAEASPTREGGVPESAVLLDQLVSL